MCVLIQYFIGGVGWAATQLAKTVPNVTIIGTVSSSVKTDEVQQNGVDSVIIFDNNFQDKVNLYPDGFDLIISNQSGGLFTFLQTLLKPLGRIVFLGANNLITNEEKLSFGDAVTKDVSLESLIVNNRFVGGLHLGTLTEKVPLKVRGVLKDIFDMLQKGQIKPRIDSVYALDDIVEATRLLAERKNVGKILIRVNCQK